MKIVMPVGPSHRDDGAPYYIGGNLNYIPGVSCVRKTMLQPEAEWEDYDAVIECDWGQDSEIFAHLPRFHPNPKKPSVCWQSDTHYNKIGWDYRMEEAAWYSAAAFAQKDATDHFSSPSQPRRVKWLPHAADHTIYTPPLKNYGVMLAGMEPDPENFKPYICDIVPQYDICFVGHPSSEERNPILDKVFRAVPNFAWRSGVFFRHAARVFHQSKIVFNWAIKHEINMRTFEAMATRSFMVVDRQQGMEELGIRDGVQCAIADTIDEAISKIHWYLDPKRESLRRKIADQGWRWYLNGHSYYHRARALLDLVGWKP